jgi:hypothetical protein
VTLLPLIAAALAAAPAPDAPDAARVTVERRLLLKEGHLFALAGPCWLARGDYYDNPGALVQISYFLSESGGPDLRVARFFSSLSAAGEEVFTQTQLKPDAQMPSALIAPGWRLSLAYGKALVGGSAVHFELQAAAHAGVLITDRATTPALSGSAALFVRATDRLFVQLEAALIASVEHRARSSVAGGVLPSLAVGVRL